MIYACSAWEFAAGAQLLKPQRLQNRALHATENLDGRTSFRELHGAFRTPYMCNYITKSCRTQREVILSHVNPRVRGIRQGEARHRKYKGLKLGGGQAYDSSAD
jgi:hypothetical protein